MTIKYPIPKTMIITETELKKTQDTLWKDLRVNLIFRENKQTYERIFVIDTPSELDADGIFSLAMLISRLLL